MAANVKLIKLLTGEDLIAEVVQSNDANEVMVRNPIRVVVLPNKVDPKTPSVGFAPWADFSEDKVVAINKSHIVTTMTPIKEFINQYNGMFGGIIAPSSSGLILP